MRESIVELVVAEGDDVGGQVVHDLHSRYPLVLGVDKRPLHHVAGYDKEHVLLFLPNLVDVTG